MQWVRQFGIVYTSLFVYRKTLEGESRSMTEQKLQPAEGGGHAFPAALWYLSLVRHLDSLSSPPLTGCLGQGRGLQQRESSQCSSARALREGSGLGFWGCVYASLPRYLSWGSWSKNEALGCCYQSHVLSRCSWFEHSTWACFLKRLTFMVCVKCFQGSQWIGELCLAPTFVTDKHLLAMRTGSARQWKVRKLNLCGI